MTVPFLLIPCKRDPLSSTMSKASPPELKKFMDKRLGLQINSGRNLIGTLRGYDPFMNLVIDECVEKMKNGEMRKVRLCSYDFCDVDNLSSGLIPTIPFFINHSFIN